MVGVLYIVPTPIGNLQDITERALQVLRTVPVIAAEDTRQCRKLLGLLDIAVPELIALHEHNEQQASDRVVQRLHDGVDVALVSDAGTPLVSDPGHLLLRRLWSEWAAPQVVPLPGPSALLTAIAACPLPMDSFTFAGFLPAKGASRRRRLQQLLAGSVTTVLFEAPHRVAVTLQEIAGQAPERRIFVARELTKRFEAFLLGDPDTVLKRLQNDDALRGEFVLVIEGRPQNAAGTTGTETESLLRALLDELPPAQAARLAARITGQRKAAMYEAALALAAKQPGRRSTL